MAKNDCYKADNDDNVDGADNLLSNDTDADNPNADLTVKDAKLNTPEIDPVSGPASGDPDAQRRRLLRVQIDIS